MTLLPTLFTVPFGFVILLVVVLVAAVVAELVLLVLLNASFVLSPPIFDYEPVGLILVLLVVGVVFIFLFESVLGVPIFDEAALLLTTAGFFYTFGVFNADVFVGYGLGYVVVLAPTVVGLGLGSGFLVLVAGFIIILE